MRGMIRSSLIAAIVLACAAAPPLANAAPTDRPSVSPTANVAIVPVAPAIVADTQLVIEQMIDLRMTVDSVTAFLAASPSYVTRDTSTTPSPTPRVERQPDAVATALIRARDRPPARRT